jgi:hypothetical protein
VHTDSDTKRKPKMTYRPFLHHPVEHDYASALLLPYHLPEVPTRVRQGALQTQVTNCDAGDRHCDVGSSQAVSGCQWISVPSVLTSSEW